MIKNFLEYPQSKKTIKAAKIIIQSLLGVILVFTIFTFVTSKSPLVFSIRSMVVLTGSMEPSLPTGSVIYTREQLAYAKNDIITFVNKSGLTVTHRITDILFSEEGTVYVTKGDANKHNDTQTINLSSVKGKVVSSIPYLGRIIATLNTPSGFLLFILLPSIIFIMLEILNIKKEIEKETEKRVIEKYGIQT